MSLGTDKIVEQVMSKILSMPNPTMFIAKFSTIDKSSDTLKQLSFVKVDAKGMLIPSHIQVLQWPNPKEGAFVILGGTLSENERIEIFELFSKEGWIESVSLPHGARPLPLSKTPKKKNIHIQEPVVGKSNDIYEILIDAICCVMCADGQAMPKERQAVHTILSKTKAPWTKEDIDKRIDGFLERVKTEGMEKLIDTTCGNLPEFTRRKKQDVLTLCLDFMARADGIKDETEMKVIERFKSVVVKESVNAEYRMQPGNTLGASKQAKPKEKKEIDTSVGFQENLKKDKTPTPIAIDWYYVKNYSKHVRQIVLELPPGSEVPARIKGSLVHGRMGELMKQSVAGLVLFLEGEDKEGKGPFIFVKANDVVNYLKGCEARIAFAFYRFPTGGILLIFVTVLSPKVKTMSGLPFIAENVHWLDGNESEELIPALINRDEIEVCFIADGLEGPCHGHFGIRAKMPEDCRVVLKKEWEGICSYHRELSPSQINRAAAMSQFEKENPLVENPVLEQGLLSKLNKPFCKLMKLNKATVKAITDEQQKALWMQPIELIALEQGNTKVINIDENGAKTTSSISSEVAKWAAPILEMMGRADKLAKQGKYREAINAYKEVLDKAPNAAIALMSIGVCYSFMGKKADAVKWMRQAKLADPENKRVIENLRIAERM